MILRTIFWPIGLLLLLLVGPLHMVSADDDYQDDAGSSQDGAGSASEDIYEPAQLNEQLTAEAKHRNSLEDDGAMPAHTDNGLTSMEQTTLSTVKPSATEAPSAQSVEQDENTAAEVTDEAPTQKQPQKHSQEYYYEVQEEEEKGQSEQKQAETATKSATTTKPTTTMIPEYVRKAKAERFPLKESSNKLPMEHDNSDYAEDEPETELEQQTQTSKESSDELYNHQAEQPVPQAQIQEHQELPFRQKPKAFKKSNEDDYYYDEQRDSESEERRTTTTPASTTTIATTAAATRTTTSTSSSTTTTTTTTTTAAPTTVPPVPAKPLLQARFGFAWPSTTTAPTTPTPVATIATTTMPHKQPKHIHVSSPRPELLPADQLRNYIKDVYIRMPLAVIVDPSAASLDKAKRLYIDALQDKNINVKIVLVTLNAAGAPAAFSFNNTREFIAGLNSTREHEGGDAFVGVLHAAELVPYDSAVFISTAQIPPHTELVQDAAITLLKKRIRLFLLWYGERAASENETEEAVGGILGEVAIRSGGEIIHIVSTEHGQHIAGNTLTLIADAYQGAKELELPVDTTLSSLHVKIDAPMRRATLETPNGEINLKKLVKFKPATEDRDTAQVADANELDAYVPLNKLRKATAFTLKLIPEQPTNVYSVFIRAERKADVFLGDIIKRFDSYYLNGHDSYPTRFDDNRMPGALSTSRMAKFSKMTHAKLKFPEERKPEENSESPSPKTEVETFSDAEVHLDASPVMNQTQVSAANVGYGMTQRSSLSGMLMQRCGTKIELSTQSKLLVAAGQMSQLFFEVTNMRAETVYQNVQVTDERRFLVQLTPSSLFLKPQETTTVRLTVLVPAGTAQGTTDRITFTVNGNERTTQAVNLKVISSIDAQDTTGPSLSWEFGSRCDYVAADAINCGERFWTLDVTAQDWQSGILRMQTTPSEGLFYRNYFTAGTTEKLKATYMASCCEPTVSVSAHDAAGNVRTINIDVRDIVLTEAAIAAIVLGAILLLLLIVLIIFGIVWCCRRRKISLELPTYRSHSTRSME